MLNTIMKMNKQRTALVDQIECLQECFKCLLSCVKELCPDGDNMPPAASRHFDRSGIALDMANDCMEEVKRA